MPTKRTRKTRRYLGISLALLAWFKDEGEPTVERFFNIELAGLWAQHRDFIVAAWAIKAPRTRPPFWWRFDAPEPLRKNETEHAYLRRHGLLLAAELSPTPCL